MIRDLGLKGGEAELHLASLHCCLLPPSHCSTFDCDPPSGLNYLTEKTIET